MLIALTWRVFLHCGFFHEFWVERLGRSKQRRVGICMAWIQRVFLCVDLNTRTTKMLWNMCGIRDFSLLCKEQTRRWTAYRSNAKVSSLFPTCWVTYKILLSCFKLKSRHSARVQELTRLFLWKEHWGIYDGHISCIKWIPKTITSFSSSHLIRLSQNATHFQRQFQQYSMSYGQWSIGLIHGIIWPVSYFETSLIKLTIEKNTER